jgi:SNF2 family DNA or RNA helicase
MDGDTKLVEKKAQEKIFNDPDNKQIRLFLISTKAGGIGINLTV